MKSYHFIYLLMLIFDLIVYWVLWTCISFTMWQSLNYLLTTKPDVLGSFPISLAMGSVMGFVAGVVFDSISSITGRHEYFAKHHPEGKRKP